MPETTFENSLKEVARIAYMIMVAQTEVSKAETEFAKAELGVIKAENKVLSDNRLKKNPKIRNLILKLEDIHTEGKVVERRKKELLEKLDDLFNCAIMIQLNQGVFKPLDLIKGATPCNTN